MQTSVAATIRDERRRHGPWHDDVRYERDWSGSGDQSSRWPQATARGTGDPLGWKKPAATHSGPAAHHAVASSLEPCMVAVSLVTDRRVLSHHEMPLFPTSKRAKVELSVCSEIPVSRAILLSLVVTPPMRCRQKYRMAWLSVRRTASCALWSSGDSIGEPMGDSKGELSGDPPNLLRYFLEPLVTECVIALHQHETSTFAGTILSALVLGPVCRHARISLQGSSGLSREKISRSSLARDR
jgi:hypothetical protein